MIKQAITILLATTALPAIAATEVWDFSQLSRTSTSGEPGYDSLVSNVVNGNQLTITGWSDTTGRTNPTSSFPFGQLDKNAGDDYLEQGKLFFYGDGVGLSNRDTTGVFGTNSCRSGENCTDDLSNGGQHSVDNLYDNDILHLSFTHAVSLTHLYSTYKVGNDLTFAAYTGDGSLKLDNTQTWGTVLAQGWSGYHEGEANSGWYQITPADDLYSTDWLIGAYNSSFDFSDVRGRVTDGLDSYYKRDGFKLAAVKSHGKDPDPGTGVPEPGTYALLLAGFFVFSSLRKQNKA